MAQIPAPYWAPSIAQSQPTNPTAPASTTLYKMQGLAQLITPTTPTGNVLFLLQATLTDGATTVGEGINLKMYYGAQQSGVAAPANAASVPNGATQLGGILTWATGVTLTTAANSLAPITMFGMAQGLTPGQQYWFDVAAESVVGASQVALTNVYCVVTEL